MDGRSVVALREMDAPFLRLVEMVAVHPIQLMLEQRLEQMALNKGAAAPAAAAAESAPAAAETYEAEGFEAE